MKTSEANKEIEGDELMGDSKSKVMYGKRQKHIRKQSGGSRRQ